MLQEEQDELAHDGQSAGAPKGILRTRSDRSNTGVASSSTLNFALESTHSLIGRTWANNDAGSSREGGNVMNQQQQFNAEFSDLDMFDDGPISPSPGAAPNSRSNSTRLLSSLRKHTSQATYEAALLSRARRMDLRRSASHVHEERINSFASLVFAYCFPYLQLAYRLLTKHEKLMWCTIFGVAFAAIAGLLYPTEMQQVWNTWLSFLSLVLYEIFSLEFLAGTTLTFVAMTLSYDREKRRALQRLGASTLTHISRPALAALLRESGVTAKVMI